MEPDHFSCMAEISTSNSSPLIKGRLDSTTLWLKSDSGLYKGEMEGGGEGRGGRERTQREKNLKATSIRIV